MRNSAATLQFIYIFQFRENEKERSYVFWWGECEGGEALLAEKVVRFKQYQDVS